MNIRTAFLNFIWHFRYRIANDSWHPATKYSLKWHTYGWVLDIYRRSRLRAGCYCLDCKKYFRIKKKYKLWDGNYYLDFGHVTNCKYCGSKRLSAGMNDKSKYN